MELFLIISSFEFMMMYLIELNQLVIIEISCRSISKELNENKSQSEATDMQDNNIQNKKRSTTKYSTKNTRQRRRQKTVDYRENNLMTLG